MAFTTNTNASADRPVTKLGEAIDQIHDHRMPADLEDSFRFCPSGVRINPQISTTMEGRMI